MYRVSARLSLIHSKLPLSSLHQLTTLCLLRHYIVFLYHACRRLLGSRYQKVLDVKCCETSPG